MQKYANVLSELNIQLFYAKWQFVVCLFSGIALMAIWWHLTKKQKDYGQVWLALSVLCWSFSGLVEVFFVQNILDVWKTTEVQNFTLNTTQELELQFITIQLEGWKSIFSLFNSLFILLALPWFRYVPDSIAGLVKSKFWKPVIGIPFLFALLPTIYRMFKSQQGISLSELDVLYALLTLLFLGVVLWSSFRNRRLPLLAWLSVFCIGITLLAQVLKFSSVPTDPLLYAAVFKTSLMMVFFALALSWVKELIENVIPESALIQLEFQGRSQKDGKFLYAIQLQGFSSAVGNSIVLTPAMYQLLHRFAEEKVETEGWLEIKPKKDDRSHIHYGVKDYNEIKRLQVALLDGLFGKGMWTKNDHEIPLKKSLFELSEKRERKIRLAIPKENISL